jgi:hypothetical protein
VLVPVPEAEPVIGPHRARLDRAAAWGVPAHVTVLYPFVPPALITSTTLRALAAAVRSVGAFDCAFGRLCWFGEQVLWLAPRPSAPFQALTSAVMAAFPAYPPFGGAFAEVVPHLTIGDRPAGGVAELRAARSAVQPQLPVRARISRAWLMTGSSAAASWRPVAALPLGPGTGHEEA